MDLIKDLTKIVDLTSQECSNYAFKPIISERSGTGCYLTDCVIVDDELIAENEHILLNSIEEIRYGYLEKVEDRIETVYCDSIEEVFDFVDRKRKDKEVVSPFFGVPMGTHFPFYEIDKIGGGFLIIRTDRDEFGIYFPTEKTTFEKQWEKDMQNGEDDKVNKRIYFVTEGMVDGEPVQSEKFNQIVNPETMEQIFDDVFQITECAAFEKYGDKEEFLATVLEMAISYFEDFGDDIGEITLVAIDGNTDIFQWGVSMKILDDGSFQYGTIDYKADGKILKFAEAEGEE